MEKKDKGSRIYIPKKEHPETKIKGEVKTFIHEQKLLINYGPRKMKLLVKRKFDIDVSTTAIYKFYRKRDLIRRPQRKLQWYKPLKKVVIPKAPGEVVQMDAKYVWRDNIRKYFELRNTIFMLIYKNHLIGGFCCHEILANDLQRIKAKS
jgi:hypothetical protein